MSSCPGMLRAIDSRPKVFAMGNQAVRELLSETAYAVGRGSQGPRTALGTDVHDNQGGGPG